MALIPAVVFAADEAAGDTAPEQITPDYEWYDDGSADEFTITTAQQLVGLLKLTKANVTVEGTTLTKTNFAGKTVRIGADITFGDNEYLYYNNGTTLFNDMGGAFAGVFDGTKDAATGETPATTYTISGLKFYNRDVTTGNRNPAVGLFSEISAGGIVSNITISNATADLNNGDKFGLLAISLKGNAENCHLKNSAAIINLDNGSNGYTSGSGGMFASVTSATITGCSVETFKLTCFGNDNSDNTGGFIGVTSGTAEKHTVIKDCTFKDITFDCTRKTKRTGGIFGNTSYTDVIDCTATDLTLYVANYYQSLGGFVGQANSFSTFTNCTLTNLKIGCGESATIGGDVGGFAGLCGSDVTFTGCSITELDMDLLSDNNGWGNGGFIGWQSGSNNVIDGCTVSGDITLTGTGTNTAAGGLVGVINGVSNEIKNSTSDATVSSNTTTGGIVGSVNKDTTITDTTSTGSVTSTDGVAGGVAGYVQSGVNITFGGDVDPSPSVNGVVKSEIANAPDKDYNIETDESITVTNPDYVCRGYFSGANVGYTTIQAALDAGATTVTLIKNASENITLPDTEGLAFTFDLGAFTLNGTVTVPKDAQITVKGSAEGSSIVLTEPSKGDDYIFQGWYSDASFTDESLVAQNTITTVNASGTTYYVKWKLRMAAAIGENEYFTLGEALEAAKAMTGDVTITLLYDGINLSGYTAFESFSGKLYTSLTIDGKGFTIRNLAQPLFDEGCGTVIVKNINFTNVNVGEITGSGGKCASVIAASICNDYLTIKNVHINGGAITSSKYASGFVAYVNNNSVLTIDGCSITDVAITGDGPSGFVGYTSSGSKIINSTVEKNTLYQIGSRPEKPASVIGTINGGSTIIDVVETAPTIGYLVIDNQNTIINASMNNANLTTNNGVYGSNAIKPIGRAYLTSATYIGGSYYADPRVPAASGAVITTGIINEVTNHSYFADFGVRYDVYHVAQIDEEKHATLDSALEAAKAMTGDVVVEITCDFDLGDWTSFNLGGAQYTSLTIDGQGYTINALGQPLFSNVANSKPLTVKDITFQNIAVNGVADLGANVGQCGAVIATSLDADILTLERISIDGGSIETTGFAGGFVGYVTGASVLTIKECSVKGITVSGGADYATNWLGDAVGGLIGIYSSTASGTNLIITDTVIGNNVIRINSLDEKGNPMLDCLGAVVGTLNGTNKVWIDVTEESPTKGQYLNTDGTYSWITATTQTANIDTNGGIYGGTVLYDGVTAFTPLKPAGRVVSKTLNVSYRGGEYYADPTVPTRTWGTTPTFEAPYIMAADKYIIVTAYNQNTGEGYTTLGEAVAAANNGDTVVLWQNAAEDIVIGKSITLLLDEACLIGKISIPDTLSTNEPVSFTLISKSGDLSDCDITLVTPEKDHHIFEGWYTTADFADGSAVADGKITTVFSAGTTYYANFEKSTFVEIPEADRTFDFGKVTYGYTETPAGQSLTFVYGGTGGAIVSIEKSPYFKTSFNGLVATIEPIAGLDAGVYDCIIHVTMHENSVHTIIVKFEVKPKEIAIDWAIAEDIIYNGNDQAGQITGTYTDINGNTVTLTVTPDRDFINAGGYTFTASFANGETNYILPSDVTKAYTIEQNEVEKPTADGRDFIYNGANQTYTVADSSLYSVSGNVHCDAGSYTVTVALSDKNNYKWANGDSEDLTYSFVIAPKNISGAIITLEKDAFIYVGAEHTIVIESIVIDGLNVSNYAVAGGNSATEVGDYTLTVTGNGNFTGEATKAWSIEPKAASVTIEFSVPQGGFIYNGSAFTPAVTVKDGDTVIPASEYEVIYSSNLNAGTATITITDVSGGNYVVTGMTTFAIAKADPVITWPTGLVGMGGKEISSVTLPHGFSWSNGTQVLDCYGGQHEITYTPDDIDNYNVLTSQASVLSTHDYGWLIAKVAPTCVATGVDAHYYCDVCDLYFTSEKVVTTYDDLILLVDLNGHTFGAVTYVWAPDNSSCTATRECQLGCGHTEAETVTAVSEVTQVQSCVNAEISKYTVTFTNAVFETQAKENIVTGAALGHSYGNLIPRVESTCSATGFGAHYFCDVCDAYFTDEKFETVYDALVIPINQNAHSYGEASYAWAEDNSSCTATRVCVHNGEHSESETVTATAVITQSKSCTDDELTKYTVNFTNSAFEAQVKENVKTADKLGHEYGELIPRVDATCSATGFEAHYLCDVCDTYFTAEKADTTAAELTIAIDDDAHSYGATAYIWAADHSACTAIRVCARNSAHKDTETAVVVKTVIQALSCTDEEICSFNATFKGVAFAAQAKENVTTAAALGHEYGELIEKVDASCAATGFEAHYLCSGCSVMFNEEKTEVTAEDMTIAIIEDAHSYNVPRSNIFSHWSKCDHCDEIDGQMNHSFVNGVCSCGYKQTTIILAIVLSAEVFILFAMAVIFIFKRRY